MPDLNKIIEDLSSLTVVEAAELSKKLEEKWGVTPMAAAAAPAAGGAAQRRSQGRGCVLRRHAAPVVCRHCIDGHAGGDCTRRAKYVLHALST